LQVALRRRAAHNGLELSCRAARATPHPFSRNSAGRTPPTFRTPAGSAAASCYAAFTARPSADAQRSITLRLPRRLIAARRRPTPRARLHYPPRLASEHDGPPSKGLPQSLSSKTPWPRPSLARQRGLPLLIGSTTMQVALRRRAAHNGLELSCSAARATVHPFSRILAGKVSPTFRTPAGSAAASCWAPSHEALASERRSHEHNGEWKRNWHCQQGKQAAEPDRHSKDPLETNDSDR